MIEVLSNEVMIAMSVFILFMILMVTMVVLERRGLDAMDAEIKQKRLMTKLWNMEEAK